MILTNLSKVKAFLPQDSNNIEAKTLSASSFCSNLLTSVEETINKRQHKTTVINYSKWEEY